MKRYAALAMAAMYLLLTTGMYVCVLSCGTNHLVQLVKKNSALESHIQGEKHNSCHEESEHCSGNENCSCCKKHGNFLVKENIKPDSTFQVLEIPAIVENACYLVINYDYPLGVANEVQYDNSAHPPPGLSPPIYLKYKSLLI